MNNNHITFLTANYKTKTDNLCQFVMYSVHRDMKWLYKSTSNCQHHHNVLETCIMTAKIKQSISQTTSNKVGLKSTYIWKRILNTCTKHSHKNAAEFFFSITSCKFWRNFAIKKWVVWIINNILYIYQLNWLT